MNDATGSEELMRLIAAALDEADRQEETLVACLLAQALDAIKHRPGKVDMLHH